MNIGGTTEMIPIFVLIRQDENGIFYFSRLSFALMTSTISKPAVKCHEDGSHDVYDLQTGSEVSWDGSHDVYDLQTGSEVSWGWFS